MGLYYNTSPFSIVKSHVIFQSQNVYKINTLAQGRPEGTPWEQIDPNNRVPKGRRKILAGIAAKWTNWTCG